MFIASPSPFSFTENLRKEKVCGWEGWQKKEEEKNLFALLQKLQTIFPWYIWLWCRAPLNLLDACSTSAFLILFLLFWVSFQERVIWRTFAMARPPAHPQSHWELIDKAIFKCDLGTSCSHQFKKGESGEKPSKARPSLLHMLTERRFFLGQLN